MMMMLLPIACRFVPYDQWFVTHIDDQSKIKHLKHWFLSKCNIVHTRGPQPHRPVSPITFAASARSSASVDSLDDGYNEDDEFSDQDLLPPRPAIYAHAPVPQCPLVDQYTLLSFSTGSILEDDFSLAWYNLRPYELLELHPLRALAPLHRDVLADYIQPYFQANVRVLRTLWNHRAGRFELDTLSSQPRKTKLDWRARCALINQGVLSLSKEHLANPPVQQFALATMKALRGADALERAFSVVAQPRVVCINFRPRAASLSPAAPSSPISEKYSVQDDSPRERSADDPDKADGEWVVLDMLDDHAFSSILRILHRLAPCPISSSFVPSITLSNPSPNVTSSAFCDAIPYPEWRISTVENARKAGMGDIGKPMAWVLWSERGLGESLLGNIRHHRQAFTKEMQYKVSTFPADYGEPEDASDEDSEMEWDGWMRDLERQNQLKQQSEKTSRAGTTRQAHISSSMSLPLPSPPLTEASPSGSPRVRSPSLSLSHLGSNYPNIGNVMQVRGYHSLDSPEMRSVTISTVSVGTTSPSRRRSSTLSAESVMTHQDKVPFPTACARGSFSPGRHCSPRTRVRHTYSSSNLRKTSSPYESDAADSPAHPGPSSPSRRQSAFMRGMSLRAGKLVKGLESAIDFVDEKK